MTKKLAITKKQARELAQELLPNDALDAIRAEEGGLTDVECDAGKVTPVSYKQLKVSIVELCSNCDLGIHDPNSMFEGCYPLEVIDLYSSNDAYTFTEGLLCWMPLLQHYGCAYESSLHIFPKATWEDLVAHPDEYLEANYGGGPEDEDAVEFLYSWLHLPFKIDDTDELILPYQDQCPLHNKSLVSIKSSVSDLNEYGVSKQLLQLQERREGREGWFSEYKTTFPCAGVPKEVDELLCCEQCRKLESGWLG